MKSPTFNIHHHSEHSKSSKVGLLAISWRFRRLRAGFTLVEILVAITIIATLTVGLVATLNPRGQVNKAQDAVRTQNINSIKLALDLYYNDRNCYPALTSSPFSKALSDGTQWEEGTTVYMKKVPKDPTSGVFYTYTTDATVCPQWGVVFAKLSAVQTLATVCPLSAKSECVPQGFDNTWACVTLGSTNCSTLMAGNLGTPTPTPSPSASSGPTATPTPTPTSGNFTVALNANPQFYQGTLSPMYPTKNTQQKIDILIADPDPVASVSAKIFSDTKTTNVVFSLTKGSTTDGTWTGTWNVNDTINGFYKITFFASDNVSRQSSVDVVIR